MRCGVPFEGERVEADIHAGYLNRCEEGTRLSCKPTDVGNFAAPQSVVFSESRL